MIITSTINVDLAIPGNIVPVYAAQDDKYSRNLEVRLYSNGIPWTPPDDLKAFANYEKSDGIGGEYDTMPDGTKAWSIEKNVLTFALAPQVLTVPGKVNFSVSLISETSEISTFIISIDVQPKPGFNIGSEEYVNMRDWLVSELYDALRLAKESGEFVGPRGPQGVPGVDGKSAYQYAKEAGYVGTEAEFSCKLSAPFIVPQMYGAKGDGSTNDTTAFQNALENNRVVRVPGGTYKLSDTLVIRENCCLELSQDTILQFTKTSGNCIEMRGSAVLRGNHAVVSVPYEFTGNAISMDTSLDGKNHASIPPYEKADPQWKRQRFVYDVNIVKPNSAGFNRPLDDGKCNGTAVYMSATNVSNDSTDIPFMWGITMSGIRIAGGFSYGIHAINYDSADGSEGHYADDAWNHDMRIEAVIEGCEIGVALENCNGAHLNVTVQPNTTVGGTKYAKQGVCLKDSRFVDMLRSRVWDWHVGRNDSEEYKHIALYGNCRGLLLDDFLVTEHPGTDIRDEIYTDTPSNFDTMTVLQEPANKWFKSVDGVPYFNDGIANRKLMLASEKITAEQVEFITPADGYYTYEPRFTNLAKNCTDGAYLLPNGTTTGFNNYTTTDFIAIDPTVMHTYRIGGDGIVWKDNSGYGRIAWYDADKNIIGMTMSWDKVGTSIYYPAWVEDDTVESAFITLTTQTAPSQAHYFRISAQGKGEDLIVTIDEKQEYEAVWHGEPKRLVDSVKVKAENVVGLTGGGGGVSSWNDLPDKPFGESENAVLLPKTQFAYDSAFGLFATPGYIDFVVGKTYTVNWNGVDYETEAVPGQFNGADLVMLGNPAALGGTNNNLPFAVACLMGAIGAIPLDGSTAVAVGITGYWLGKVSAKYLETQYTITIPKDSFTQQEGNVYAVTMPYDTTELVDAILEGRNLYLVLEDGLTWPTRLPITMVQPIEAARTFEDAIMGAINRNGKDKVPLLLASFDGADMMLIAFNGIV